MKTDHLKAIPCENCGKTLLFGAIVEGIISKDCSKCGVRNVLTFKKSSTWETINTSTSDNVLNMRIVESKDWTEIIHKNKL